MSQKTEAKKKPESEVEKKTRESIEEIAKNISELARTVRALTDGKLNKKALIVLLAHTTQLPQWKVEAVLKALGNLDAEWLNH